MANTNELKNVIEPALLEQFWREYGARQVVPSPGLRSELFGMELDGIGIQPGERSLLVCETTASGFLGHRGKDFHIGATRKFADAFARFSIIMHPPTRDALLLAASRDYHLELEHIKCSLVVPKGSRFIRALGYRVKLLEMGVMKLVEVELSRDEGEILERVLRAASAEMA